MSSLYRSHFNSTSWTQLGLSTIIGLYPTILLELVLLKKSVIHYEFVTNVFFPAHDGYFSYSILVTNGVYVEKWERIDYKRIRFLLADPRYPNLPSYTMCVPTFEQPSNWGDFFGTRLRTYFVPFQDGKHYFFLCKK